MPFFVWFPPSRVLSCFTCLVLSTANTQNQRCTIWLDSSLWWSYPPWSGGGHIPTSLSTGWRIWQNQRKRGSTLSVIGEYVSMVTLEELASSPTLLCTYQVWSVPVQLCKDSGGKWHWKFCYHDHNFRTCKVSAYPPVPLGCGDYVLSEVSVLPDPCPLPDAGKKRSLNEREKQVYAPMAGVGGIVYDKVGGGGIIKYRIAGIFRGYKFSRKCL